MPSSTVVPARAVRGRGRCASRRRVEARSSARARPIETTTTTIATDARATATAIATAAFVLAARAAMAGDVSPFAGVVDVFVLALVAYLAKLGNERAAKRARASKTRDGSPRTRRGRR